LRKLAKGVKVSKPPSKELVVADEVVDAEIVDEPAAGSHPDKTQLLQDLGEPLEHMMAESQRPNIPHKSL
jgi:hypothetical protein